MKSTRIEEGDMSVNRILIIEDEVSIAKLLQYKLQAEGFDVQMAHDGTSGLDAMESFKPSLVLLDLMLPDMSGMDVCKIITKRYNLPILILTAKTDIVDKVQGLESGADDYITKPFDFRCDLWISWWTSGAAW